MPKNRKSSKKPTRSIQRGRQTIMPKSSYGTIESKIVQHILPMEKTPSTPAVLANFKSATLLKDLKVTSGRFVRLVYFECRFSPLGPPAKAESPAFVSVQLLYTDLSTKSLIPITDAIPLSDTNPKTVSFRAHLPYWLAIDDDQPLCAISYTQLAQPACGFIVTDIRARFQLSADPLIRATDSLSDDIDDISIISSKSTTSTRPRPSPYHR